MGHCLTLPGPECNNGCSFCSYTGRVQTPGTQQMPTVIVKALMRKIEDKAQPVILRGIEPTLRDDFFEVLRYAKQIGIGNLTLESNGRVFYYKDFCEKVMKEGVSSFTIYLFGPDAHLHDHTQLHDKFSHVRGSFYQSVDGIRNLLKLKARVKVLFILTANHDFFMKDYLDFITKLQPTSVAFLYIDMENRNIKTTDKVFVQHLGEYIRDLITGLRKAGIRIEDNGYEGSLDLATFFDDLKDDIPQRKKSFPASSPENKKRAVTEFGGRKLALSAKPLKVFVELTRNCNFRCIMCPQPLMRGYDHSLDMPWPLFKRIADSLFPYAEYVDLRGFGESVIMKDWRKCLDYALKFDCKYGIITNLSTNDDEMWRLMAKNNFFFGVSFDGATKKTFEYIRRGANFDLIMRNLRNITKWNREFGHSEDNIKLMATAQKENIHELPGIVEIAKGLGVKEVQFSPSRVMYEDAVLDRDDVFNRPEIVKPILEKSVRLARESGINLLLTGSLKQKKTESAHGYAVQRSCDHPWTHLYVTSEGLVGPCNQLMLPLGILLGDLRKNSFEEIWNNFNFRLFRKLMDTPHRLNYCDWCFENRYGD